MEGLKHLDFSFASEDPMQDQIRQSIVKKYENFCKTRIGEFLVIGEVDRAIFYDLVHEIAANNTKALDFIKIGCDLIRIDTPENLAKMNGMTGKEISQSAFCVFMNYKPPPRGYEIRLTPNQ